MITPQQTSDFMEIHRELYTARCFSFESGFDNGRLPGTLHLRSSGARALLNHDLAYLLSLSQKNFNRL